MGDPFAPRSERDIVDLIDAYPLAWVVSSSGTEFQAAPLPLLADCDATGAVVRLVGHMARANPLRAQLEADPRALVLFQGPQGYMSPAWVPDRSWAPTWNYVTVQFEVDIRFRPDATDRAIERLVEKMEAGRERPWSPCEMGDRYARLREAIIAFDAEVRSTRARFKLGQDERPEMLDALIAGSPDAELRLWMARHDPRNTR